MVHKDQMDPSTLIVVAVLILGYGMVSRRLDGSVITPPMIFVATGLAMGPQALGILEVGHAEHVLHGLAELTLTLILFGDAARIDLRALRRELGLPVRLLSFGLPLSIVLGTVIAKLVVPVLSWLEAGVLASVLAPTDAALGQAVVSSPVVPLRVRQALNVESGLNDGIVLPLVTVLAGLAGISDAPTRSAGEWATFALLQVTLGPLAGVVVGFVGARAIGWADARGWMSSTSGRLSGLALALLAFASAEAIGGNGFIAAFIGGITLGHVARHLCKGLHSFLEAEGQLLMLLVFLLLGSALLWPALTHANAAVFIYGALSLTVIRIIPVTLAMIGAGVRTPTIGFMGWFGPRGLASLLFAILIINDANLPHGELIFSITLVTVLISIFAHGITASPLAVVYGKLTGDATQCPAEHKEVSTHPLRKHGI